MFLLLLEISKYTRSIFYVRQPHVFMYANLTIRIFLQNKQIVDYFTSNQVSDTSLYTLAWKIYDMSEAIEQF